MKSMNQVEKLFALPKRITSSDGVGTEALAVQSSEEALFRSKIRFMLSFQRNVLTLAFANSHTSRLKSNKNELFFV